jgi:hypothetical protein
MGANTFKIVTGIVFPPLGVYYGLRAAGLPSWAGTAGMALFGGGLGIALAGYQVSQMIAGNPGAPAMPSITAGGGGMSGSPTYGFSTLQAGRR